MGNSFSANTSTAYPFSYDGRRLTFGKYKGQRYWDVTAIDEGYCLWILTEGEKLTSHPNLRQFRQYLIDRGFPFVKSPEVVR